MIVEDIFIFAPIAVKAYDNKGDVVAEYTDRYIGYTDNYLEEIVMLCHATNPTVVRVVLDIALKS